ncbi:SDR family NAD(P)-dependent oxidoreductase [Neptuniibacter halophilus]|uniref:SDR family NAD(P)-dependent oxidoreductase n=1 Tax=Neptuniibacter halophilus TaxID=651666 RepID=UPI0025746DB2|nr:glucose 1-dehydrogenase [Neptuniibacter halophilus]
MTNLKDKVLIVTGGASGIGKAAATFFSQCGATVVIADFNDQGSLVAEEITANGGKCLFVKTNVVKESEVENLVAKTIEAFGRLDGAFNAGVEQAIKPLHEIEETQWDKVINIDLKGVFLCIKHQVKAMLNAGHGGAIVNTSSTVGIGAVPFAAEYIAAKAGVIGLTRAAAVDYAQHGIRVNTVAPGMTQTAMIDRMPKDPELMKIFGAIQAAVPMQRMGQPQEIVEAVGWLLSDAASFITGAVLPVDGGHTAV